MLEFVSFWVVALCSVVVGCQCFGGLCCLPSLGLNIGIQPPHCMAEWSRKPWILSSLLQKLQISRHVFCYLIPKYIQASEVTQFIVFEAVDEYCLEEWRSLYNYLLATIPIFLFLV